MSIRQTTKCREYLISEEILQIFTIPLCIIHAYEQSKEHEHSVVSTLLLKLAIFSKPPTNETFY